MQLAARSNAIADAIDENPSLGNNVNFFVVLNELERLAEDVHNRYLVGKRAEPYEITMFIDMIQELEQILGLQNKESI